MRVVFCHSKGNLPSSCLFYYTSFWVLQVFFGRIIFPPLYINVKGSPFRQSNWGCSRSSCRYNMCSWTRCYCHATGPNLKPKSQVCIVARYSPKLSILMLVGSLQICPEGGHNNQNYVLSLKASLYHQNRYSYPIGHFWANWALLGQLGSILAQQLTHFWSTWPKFLLV